MRDFIILWSGQLVSDIGSSMTYFTLTIWVWQRTQSATAIALILFFYQLPQIAISLLSGVLIDRVSRKRLLIISDTASACCTISVGILAALQILQPWQIYVIAALIGCFGNVQSLTYSTLVPLIVPPQHHARATSMGSMVGYGAGILSPALAGMLYPQLGLLGITVIDMATFAIAMLALYLVRIPPVIGNLGVEQQPEVNETKKKIWREVTFGFSYIASHPGLLATIIALSTFTFFNEIAETLYQPMILARTGGDTQVLGLVVAVSGIGGVIGAIAFSMWGGFRRRIFGILVGFVGSGLSQLLLGLGSFSTIWAVACFGMTLNNPLIFSSYMAIWYSKVAPELQGRVFAADYLVGIVVQSSANLSAGLLADRVFEPLMQSQQWFALLIGKILGTGEGSGMSLLIIISAIAMMLVGIGGFTFRQVRNVDISIVD
jgi:MFS transporter, DHA3 family, macrolide efflux protein